MFRFAFLVIACLIPVSVWGQVELAGAENIRGQYSLKTVPQSTAKVASLRHVCANPPLCSQVTDVYVGDTTITLVQPDPNAPFATSVARLVQRGEGKNKSADLVLGVGTERGIIESENGSFWDAVFSLSGDIAPGTAVVGYFDPVGNNLYDRRILFIFRSNERNGKRVLVLESLAPGVTFGIADTGAIGLGREVPVGSNANAQTGEFWYALDKAVFMQYGNGRLRFEVNGKPMASTITLEIARLIVM